MSDIVEIKDHENVIAGIVGAFLFALAGGILWFILYQVGYLAGISGIVAVVCAIKGYSVFAKKESLKGVIISIIAAILVILLAWYLCLSLDLYKACQEWYANGEVESAFTYFESVRVAYLFLSDSTILAEYLMDLCLGLLLCGVGAYRSVANAIHRIKQDKELTSQC